MYIYIYKYKYMSDGIFNDIYQKFFLYIYIYKYKLICIQIYTRFVLQVEAGRKG